MESRASTQLPCRSITDEVALSPKNSFVEIFTLQYGTECCKWGPHITWWVGQPDTVSHVARTCRALRSTNRFRCELCGNLHSDHNEVFLCIVGPHPARYRPLDLEQQDMRYYLTHCLACIMAHRDPLVDRLQQTWCSSCRSWVSMRAYRDRCREYNCRKYFDSMQGICNLTDFQWRQVQTPSAAWSDAAISIRFWRPSGH
jgi:hypothetical protein